MSVVCYLTGGHVLPCIIAEVNDSYLLARNQQHSHVMIAIKEIVSIAFD